MIKTRKRLAMKNVTGIFLAALLAIAMLCGTTPEAAGMPLSYFLMLILAVLYASCWIWNIRRGDRGLWRLERRVDVAVLALILWNLLSIMGKMFQDPDTGAIRYSFQAVWIVLGLLYFAFKEARTLRGWYLDLILYAGLFVEMRMLLEYTGVWKIGWRSDLMTDSGMAASYLLLPCMVSVLRYCFCRDRLRSAFYFLTAAFGFLVLWINYNVPSLWIMTFVFLAVPIVIRPTAELVKRDMQLFFLYGILLGGMSLLTGYTQILQKELQTLPEHGLYLLLLLAVGGAAFFRYWRRIPKGIDKDRLVLRRMRRGYQFAFVMLGIAAAILILGGSVWAQMQEVSVGAAFVRSFAVPFAGSIGAGGNGWSLCLSRSRVSTFLLLILATLLALDMQRTSSFSRPQAAGCRLIAYAFLAQTFWYVPDTNVLPVYLLFFVWAVFYREPRRNIVVTGINLAKGEKKDEKQDMDRV